MTLARSRIDSSSGMSGAACSLSLMAICGGAASCAWDGDAARAAHSRAALIGKRSNIVGKILPSGRPAYSAASNSSAPPRSTLTRRLTPFSIIVTPNRRCILLMVTALWVTIR